MQNKILSAKRELVDTLKNLLAALSSSGPNPAAAHRKRICDAAVALADLVNGFPADLRGHLAPIPIFFSLLDFVNSEINIPYAANGPERIPHSALPPPKSWLRKLNGLIEDFGGDKPKQSTSILWPEDELLLQTLAEASPASVTQPNIIGLMGLEKRKISKRVRYLESKRFIQRPEGTQRKGHGITAAGLSAIGQLTDGAP